MTEFDLPAKSWFGKCKTSYALKEALIQYKESKEKNEEMIEFLCENILDNKEEFALFYPEFIRALILCLPFNHKIVSSFIPDETAAKDFILFERNFKVYEGFPVNPYSVYYSNEVKLNMWGDFSDIFVSDLYPNLLQKLFTKIDEIVQEQAGFEHIIAEVFRKLLISALKLSKFDNLVSILANSGSVWKFVKMIFIDTIKNEYGEDLSQEATDVFTSVLKNKQYFISPIEGLVHNGDQVLAQRVMKYATEHNIMHKLCNISKKNDLLHCDFIVRKFGNEDTVRSWKDLNDHYQKSIISNSGEANQFLQQVIDNCNNAPETDSEMEAMIRLPS